MDKFLSFISLARKAGAAHCGSFKALNCARANKAYLFILAADASENTKNDAKNLADYKQIRLIECYTKETLGTIAGRAGTSLIAISDERMAAKILSMYEDGEKKGDVR